MLRGPEVERWFGTKEGQDPGVENDWCLLPFMALSDGAHAYAFNPFFSVRPIDRLPDLPRTSLILPCLNER